MSDRVHKSDLSIENDKYSSVNNIFDDQNSTKNKSDEGGSYKQIVKPDGLHNKDNINKIVDNKKVIDQFIKQYLPDRGDSKRLVSNTNRIPNNLNNNVRNSNVIKKYDTGKSSYKVDDKTSNTDILIIPETGERVCNRDIKLSYANSVKRNEALNRICNFRNKIDKSNNRFRNNDRHVFQEQKQLYNLNPKLTGNSVSLENKSKNESVNKNKDGNQKEKLDIKHDTNEQLPKNTAKLIDQILRQTGISAVLRKRNQRLYSNIPHITSNKENKLSNNIFKTPNNNFERTERHRFPVKDYTKLSNRYNLCPINQRINDPLLPERVIYRKFNANEKDKKQLDPNKRKTIKTTKLKNSYEDKEVLYQSNEYKTVKYSEKPVSREEKQNISSDESQISANTYKLDTAGIRKSTIKTVPGETNSSKMYNKAVKFNDEKHVIPLHVNFLGVKRKISKINTMFKSRIRNSDKASLKEKSVTRRVDSRKRKQNRHISAPEGSLVSKMSPITEIAKWQPHCINEHTKPYYEAWVNTTLAAIARDDENNKLLLEKQRIIEDFKKALEERPGTPDSYDGFLNEKYTGKITVRQRRKHKSHS